MTADTQNSYRNNDGAIPRPSPRHADVRPRRACASRNSGPVFSMPPIAPMYAEPTPIWLAALIASRCLAVADGVGNPVRWRHLSGRALYTNLRSTTETIEPLGVSLQQGHTLAVSWIPGDTAYTIEVFQPYDRCA